MLHRTPARAAALLASALLLAACGTVTTDIGENPFTARAVRNPDPIHTNASESKVEKAVAAAAKAQGWEVLEDDVPMRLRRNYDEMTANIKVLKEGDLVVIQLESSTNMHQHESKGTTFIHWRYNEWAGELANAVKAELAK